MKNHKKYSLPPLSGYISYILAFVWLFLGLIFAVWPDFSSRLLCFLTGVTLTASGAIMFLWSLVKMTRKADYPYAIELSIVCTAVGIWIFLQTDTFLSIVPILCGALFFMHGLVDGMKGWKLYRRKHHFWWTALAAGGILLIPGIVLFFQPFQTPGASLRFIGISLLFNGLTDLWLCFCLSFAGRYSLKEEVDSEEA